MKWKKKNEWIEHTLILNMKSTTAKQMCVENIDSLHYCQFEAELLVKLIKLILYNAEINIKYPYYADNHKTKFVNE